MKLTQQTDYALRMLMMLAVNTDDLITVAEIADRYDISKNHLMKVAYILGQEGVVQSVRGRGGGLRLARPADAINVGKLVRKLEQPTALVQCFPGGKGACLITSACRLKGALAKAIEAFYAVLEDYTIADLATDNTAMQSLLKLEAV